MEGRAHAVRPAAVAGAFYPSDPTALAGMVDALLAQAGLPEAAAPPQLLLVPHAGYIYSGPVAAHAYARLRPRSASRVRVVLLGPSHRVRLRGLAVPSVSAFATPLGIVPIDQGGLARLAALPQVTVDDRAHAGEHALEVQLPFLQRVLSDFTLVPLVVGLARPGAVAEVLEQLWDAATTLILVSSDLSHYLPYAEAQDVDHGTVRKILALDATIDPERACGAFPLNGALTAARRRGLRPRLLDLRNSGDTAGDRSRVVGYCAVAMEGAV